MRLSNSNAPRPEAEFKAVIETMVNVTLPLEFWDEFYLVAGKADEIYENHEILKKLT